MSRFRLLLPCVLTLISCWLFSSQQPILAADSLSPPRVRQGQIDLRSWPMSSHGAISLQGDWSFIWMSQTPPVQGVQTLIKVPGRWEKLDNLPPWQTHFGEAEYRLKLRLAHSDLQVPLQLSSRLISTRFQCWYGPQLIGQSGLNLNAAPVAARQNVFTPFFAKTADIDIRCRVSNYSYLNSGLVEPLILNRALTAEQAQVRYDMWICLLLGCVLFMIVYHFLLAALRPDKLLIWYGLNGFLNLIYYDFLYLHLIENSLGLADFNLNLLVVRLTLYINPIIFNWYLTELFPEEMYPTWRRLNNLAMLPLIVSTLLFPTALHAPSILLNGLMVSSHFTLWLCLMIKAARNQKEGAWFFIAGMSVISVTALSDAMFTLGLNTDPGKIIYGFIVFMFSQALLIAKRYTRVWQESEHLSVSLGHLAEHLEARVEERTRQLKEQSERIEALNRFKESISQMFIHDLKNPLAVIVAQQTPNIQAWRRVRAAASQMQQLVLNLLDTSRFRQAGIQLNLSQHPFNELLSAAIGEVEYFASQRRLEMVERMEAYYYLKCDGELIRRVLVNLLSNAIRHAPTGSVIRLETSVTETDLCFRILDQGPGISAEHQAQLFEPFASFEAGKIQELASSGLGLNFCKLVVQAHHGQIELESQPGQGTCVWFKLPLVSRISASLTPKIEQMVLPEQAQLRLSAESRILLEPFARRLQQSEIHEISTIRLIARELKMLAEDYADISEWRRQLILAGDTFDEQTFNYLIHAVLNPGTQAVTPEASE